MVKHMDVLNDVFIYNYLFTKHFWIEYFLCTNEVIKLHQNIIGIILCILYYNRHM